MWEAGRIWRMSGDELTIDPVGGAHAYSAQPSLAGGHRHDRRGRGLRRRPDGPWPDAAAHSYRGVTGRNAVMFGRSGRLYTYLSHGIHVCANVVCGPDGIAAAVLLRAAASRPDWM